IDPLRGATLGELDRVTIHPASHYVTEADERRAAVAAIREELEQRLAELRGAGKLAEAERLESRTRRFEVPGRSSSRSCGCQQRDGHFCQCDEVASLTETCWTN